MSQIRFDDQVAIVTGAGGGLGRQHALELARRGARVVVNDLGGSVAGEGGSVSAAEAVVAEIEAAGGEATANGASVTDEAAVAAMVAATEERWGRVDILVNNAGILRDKSFHKMTLDDFRAVLEVHLWGSVVCTRAVWNGMRERGYGRVVMTTSSSGLYGNFGQSNYGAAKMGVIGLMNTLAIEGAAKGIHVNALSPTAATRMTEGLVPDEAMALMGVETVTPALLYLASRDAPQRTILTAGAGGYACAQIAETDGIWLDPTAQTPEAIRDAMAQITDQGTAKIYTQGAEQTMKFVGKAAAGLGVRL